MSYSKLSNSEFYTYWQISDSLSMRHQIFAVHHDDIYEIHYFTFGEIFKSKKRRKIVENKFGYRLKNVLWEELSSYFDKWLLDVRNDKRLII